MQWCELSPPVDWLHKCLSRRHGVRQGVSGMKQEGKWVVVAKGTQEVNEYLDNHIDDEGGNDYFLDKLLKMVLF